MSVLDPNTPLGVIVVNVIAALAAAAVLTALAWITGPLRWLVQNHRLKELLHSERKFTFVFNPLQGMSKVVTFLPNGDIGEGRNINEHTWKISKGALEIFSSDGQIYSRFTHDKVTGYLKHTNETAMPSIQGQYFQPGFVRRK